MENFAKLIAACDPDELPALRVQLPPEKSRARIRRRVREKLHPAAYHPARFGALRGLAAAFAVLLGITLTITLIPSVRNFIANSAFPTLTPGVDTTSPIEFPETNETLRLQDIVEDGNTLYFRFVLKIPEEIDTAALLCRNVTLTTADGDILKQYGWDIDDPKVVANALLAGDVFCGTGGQNEVMFQFTARKGAVQYGDMLTLTIDGLIGADYPEDEVVICPIAESLSCTFIADNTRIFDPEKITNEIGVTDGPITVVGTRMEGYSTYFRFRVELDEPLAGRFLLAKEVLLANSEGDSVSTVYNPREMTEKNIAASIMAGDILAVGAVGDSFFEFEVRGDKSWVGKMTSGEVLTLTITELVNVATEDAVEMEIFRLADKMEISFSYKQ